MDLKVKMNKQRIGQTYEKYVGNTKGVDMKVLRQENKQIKVKMNIETKKLFLPVLQISRCRKISVDSQLA